jgi:hypothetical protein
LNPLSPFFLKERRAKVVSEMALPFLCTILTVTISSKGYLGLKIRETANNNKGLTGGTCYGMRWGLGLVFLY